MNDALTDVLSSVRMQGSVFSRASLAAPWGVESGELGSGIFHAVVRGRAYARLVAGGEPVVLERGDVVMFPGGDNHLITDEPNRATRPISTLTTIDSRGMGHLVVTGSGPATSLICGTVDFGRGEARSVFAALPPLIHVRDVAGSLSRVVESLIELIAAEVDGHHPGSEIVVSRLTEVLIIHVLRDYIRNLPEGEVGWLGALRDPEISAALGLIHSRPERPWSARELAAAVGLSRSALFAKFKDLVGETPAQYLTRWRVHLAGRMLRDEGASVTATARRVGYATDAAFSNAFMRVMGVRPGAYRRTS
jgi:AraC-like DNA-binding protein